MFEKLQDWMDLHSAVLNRFPIPGYLMIVSCLIAMVVSLFYQKAIYAIATFEIAGVTPYQEFIIKHAKYIGLGMWILPLTILIVLMLLSCTAHQKNVKKYYL